MKQHRIPGHLRVCSVVGGNIDMLPHFIRHYRALQVSSFHIIVHFCDKNDPVGHQAVEILQAHGLAPESTYVGPWHEFLNHQSLIAKVMTQYPDDWFLVADLDELQVYPQDLAAVIATCEAKSYDYVLGCFVDRFAADGSFPPVTTGDIWKQFPLAGFVSHPILKAYPEKVMLCRGRVPLAEGQHSALAGRPCPYREIYGQIHHFKWIAGIMDRLRARLEKIEAGEGQKSYKIYFIECKAFLRYFDDNGGKIDISDPRLLLARSGQTYDSYPLWKRLVTTFKGTVWSRLRSRIDSTLIKK